MPFIYNDLTASLAVYSNVCVCLFASFFVPASRTNETERKWGRRKGQITQQAISKQWNETSKLIAAMTLGLLSLLSFVEVTINQLASLLG